MLIKDVPDVVKAVMDNFCLPTLMSKGADYARQRGPTAQGADDLTYNMSIIAERCGPYIDQFDVWAVNFQKQMQALETWLNSKDEQGARKLDSEPIHERIKDIINYALILWMMGVDAGIMPDPRKPTRRK